MSDPVTNVDIEDVLSSIRRLVSDDARPAEGAPDVSPALVLTQDHRVDRSDEPQSNLEDAVRESARSELERAIAELEAAVGLDSDDAPEPAKDSDERSEEADQFDGDWTESVDETVPAEAAMAVEETANPSNAGDQDSAAADAATDIDWEAPIGTAIDGSPPDSTVDMEPEPEGDVEDHSVSEDEPEQRSQQSRMDGGAAAISAADKIEIITNAEADVDLAAGEEDQPAEVPSEILEATVQSDDSNDAENVPAADGDEAEYDGDDFVEPEGPFDTTHDDPFPTFETLEETPAVELQIDEDMLRDMVADIVRTELQGELGERITRNVRKLVRREINRALAGQDLI